MSGFSPAAAILGRPRRLRAAGLRGAGRARGAGLLDQRERGLPAAGLRIPVRGQRGEGHIRLPMDDLRLHGLFYL
jgi:hypothetical protein